MATYYIKKDISSQYFWVLKSSNGETICKSSESYVSKDGAKKSVEWTRINAKTDDIRDIS